MVEQVSILTWCYNNGKTNYGQILQCYAMQELFRKIGYETQIVRYRKPQDEENVPNMLSDRNAYEVDYRYDIVEKARNTRIDRFISFIRENIVLSDQCYTKEEIEKICENSKAVICGSDQIWNPIWFDDVYALNFKINNAKKIAYAPSGIAVELDEWKSCFEHLGKCLEDYDYVSVREKDSISVLSKYTDKEIEDVLDPTLMLTKEEWDIVAAKPLYDESYIFCYSLGRLRQNKVLLRYLMNKYNAQKVLFITSGHYEREDELEADDIFIPIRDAGPSEFVSLIKNATAVCTDSFHGLALSIIYHKNFYVFKRASEAIELWANMSRQRCLLDRVNMANRWVRNCKEINNLGMAVYDDSLIENERNRIFELLRKVLKDEPFV